MEEVNDLYVHNINDKLYKIGRSSEGNSKYTHDICKKYSDNMIRDTIYDLSSIQKGGMIILSSNKKYTDKELDDIQFKSNKDVKILFSKISGKVMWNIYEDPSDAYDSGKKTNLRTTKTNSK